MNTTNKTNITAAYQEEIRAALKVWDDEIDRLVAKRDKAEAEARIGYSCLIAVLRTKRDRIRDELRKLRDLAVGPLNLQWRESHVSLSSIASDSEEVNRILLELSQNETRQSTTESSHKNSGA